MSSKKSRRKKQRKKELDFFIPAYPEELKEALDTEIARDERILEGIEKKNTPINYAFIIPLLSFALNLYSQAPLTDYDLQTFLITVPLIGLMVPWLYLLGKSGEFLLTKYKKFPEWYFNLIDIRVAITTSVLMFIFFFMILFSSVLFSTELGILLVYYSILIPLNAGGSLGNCLISIRRNKKRKLSSKRKRDEPDNLKDEIIPILESPKKWLYLRIFACVTLVIIPALILFSAAPIQITLKQLSYTIIFVAIIYLAFAKSSISHSSQIVSIHLDKLQDMKKDFNSYGAKNFNKYRSNYKWIMIGLYERIK